MIFGHCEFLKKFLMTIFELLAKKNSFWDLISWRVCFDDLLGFLEEVF